MLGFLVCSRYPKFLGFYLPERRMLPYDSSQYPIYLKTLTGKADLSLSPPPPSEECSYVCQVQILG